MYVTTNKPLDLRLYNMPITVVWMRNFVDNVLRLWISKFITGTWSMCKVLCNASIGYFSSLRQQYLTWWRHQMETFSALLALCAGNSPVTGEFPSQGQWRGALMFSLICTWIYGWVNNLKAVDWKGLRVHYDVRQSNEQELDWCRWSFLNEYPTFFLWIIRYFLSIMGIFMTTSACYDNRIWCGTLAYTSSTALLSDVQLITPSIKKTYSFQHDSHKCRVLCIWYSRSCWYI